MAFDLGSGLLIDRSASPVSRRALAPVFEGDDFAAAVSLDNGLVFGTVCFGGCAAGQLGNGG